MFKNFPKFAQNFSEFTERFSEILSQSWLKNFTDFGTKSHKNFLTISRKFPEIWSIFFKIYSRLLKICSLNFALGLLKIFYDFTFLLKNCLKKLKNLDFFLKFREDAALAPDWSWWLYFSIYFCGLSPGSKA